MATPHALINEPFTLIARVQAKKDAGDQLQELFAKERAFAESDEEPGCLMYKTSRGVGEESDHFTVYESYKNRDALVEHRKSETYQTLFKANLVEKVEIIFQNEFQ